MDGIVSGRVFGLHGGGIVTQRSRNVLIAILGLGVVGIAALTGCSPLPGRTMDPIYWKLGTKPDEEATPATPSPAKAAPPGQTSPQAQVRLPPQASLPPSGSSPGGAMPTGASLWVGRYRDNRGEGDITFSLVRGETTVSGTWRLRTGGGGPIAGIVEADKQRFQLRMENIGPECPARLEGSAEFRGSTLVGNYQGRDCEGPISGGRFELHAK